MLRNLNIYKMKALFTTFLFISSLSLAYAGEIPLIEKRKDYNFNFSAGGVEKIEIDNQFGDVTVQFVNQKNITISVTVKANAPSNHLLEDYIESIQINGNRDGEKVKVATSIRKGSFNMNSWNKDKNANFKIDYEVFMPKNIALKVNDSFGTVTIPEFTAPIALNLNYCTLNVESISNQNSKINLNYGSANIKSLTGGDLASNFTAINLGEARNINMNNNNGSIKAKYLEDIEGILNYSGGVLGNIKDAVKLKINYTNNLRIEKIDDKLKNLQIFSNYSNIDLPISEKFNGNFDIKTNFGSFWIDPNLITHFLKNSATDKKQSGTKSPINTYQGKIGKQTSSDSKIIVISNFGDVKIK